MKLPGVVSGPMTAPVLDVGSVPAQLSDPEPPVAVQPVALLVCQLNTVEAPATRVLGKALKDAMAAAGGGAALTLRMTELDGPGPVLPLQVNV
jgi:hypothetical protein